jgi:hypothetical protein
MSSRWPTLAVAVALFSLPAFAQDGAAGRWNASVDTPNGTFQFVLDFLVDAAGKLTGSMKSDFGSTPITQGMVNGKDISFKLTFEGGPNGPMTVGYKGTVKGDELALTSKLEGTPPGGGPAEQSFTAKRVH